MAISWLETGKGVITMNYQRIILVGNVTRDAERRTSQSGEVTYTSFGVGVSDGKDKTTFFPVLVFGKYGETVAQYITKGRQVLVDGRVQVSDNDRFRVIADRVRFGSEPTATKDSE
jgi:single stranded DNA-binding protein